MKVLVNLSGGIDSVYCLHLMLKQGYDVLVHHIRLRNWEGRADVEYASVKHVLNHFRNKGYAKQISYQETGFDYGTVRYIAYDLHVWSFMTAILLTNPGLRNSIDGVVISSHSDSPFMTNPDREQRRRNLVKSVLDDWEPQWLYPIGNMTKREVVAAIPEDLLKLCWWCRRPTGRKACGRCHTCKQVNEGIKERKRLGAAVRDAQSTEEAPSA